MTISVIDGGGGSGSSAPQGPLLGGSVSGSGTVSFVPVVDSPTGTDLDNKNAFFDSGRNGGGTGSAPTPTTPAAQGLSQNLRNNLPFDRRIMVSGVPGNTNLSTGLGTNQITKGFITTVVQASNPSSRSGQITLFFQFNPTTVNTGFSFDPSKLTSDVQSDASNAIADMTTGTTTGFQLLFDRSYEASDEGGSADRLHPGVLLDIAVVRAILGDVDGTDTAPVSLPVDVFIGGADLFGGATTGRASKKNLVNFRGRITGFSYNITRFTASMVPVRCIMDFQFQRVFRDINGNVDGSNTNLPTPISGVSSNVPLKPKIPFGKAGIV